MYDNPKKDAIHIFSGKNTKEGQPQNDFPPFLFKNKYIMSGNNSQKGSPKGNLYLDHKIRTQPRADILLSSRNPSGVLNSLPFNRSRKISIFGSESKQFPPFSGGLKNAI